MYSSRLTGFIWKSRLIYQQLICSLVITQAPGINCGFNVLSQDEIRMSYVQIMRDKLAVSSIIAWRNSSSNMTSSTEHLLSVSETTTSLDDTGKILMTGIVAILRHSSASWLVNHALRWFSCNAVFFFLYLFNVLQFFSPTIFTQFFSSVICIFYLVVCKTLNRIGVRWTATKLLCRMWIRMEENLPIEASHLKRQW